MWTTILSMLASPVLNGLLKAYQMRLAAAGAADQVTLNLAIQTIQGEIAARQQATVMAQMENGRWWTAAPRSLVQWGCALFVVKCIVWDNMLGLGHTDPLSGDIANVFGMVMVMWFGGRTLEKMTSIVANRFSK